MPEVVEAFGVLGAWLLGLSVGLTACTVSCLPFMGSWVIGRAGGAAHALGDALAFVAGRIAGYAVLGAVAGATGEWLVRALGGGAGHAWVGLGAVAAAGALLVSGRRRARCGGGMRLPPAVLGAALAMVPCAPLASLAAAAATTQSAATGAAFGVAFGTGAAVTPLLLVLPALGAFARRLRGEQPWLGRWLRIGATLALLAIGLRELSAAAALLRQ